MYLCGVNGLNMNKDKVTGAPVRWWWAARMDANAPESSKGWHPAPNRFYSFRLRRQPSKLFLLQLST